MANPNYLHGVDGGVTVGGKVLEATSWSGNPFEVDEHVFVTFVNDGAKTGVGGAESGRPINIVVKAKAEDDIRAADTNLKERAVLPTVLKEPGMATGHTGDMLVLSVMPPTLSANAEMEYAIRGVSVGKWTRGTRAAIPPEAP